MSGRRWALVPIGVVFVALIAGWVAMSGSDGADGRVPSPANRRDCGTFVDAYSQGPEIEGFRCAARAFAAGDEARLEVTFFTDEGAPVKHTFETDGRIVRVSADYSEDPLSGGGVEVRECRRWELDLERGEVMPQECAVFVDPPS